MAGNLHGQSSSVFSFNKVRLFWRVASVQTSSMEGPFSEGVAPVTRRG